jgi:hypothetical protein
MTTPLLFALPADLQVEYLILEDETIILLLETSRFPDAVQTVQASLHGCSPQLAA